MDFENIVISPPDNYRFLNFIPIVIYLYTLRYENLNIVWRSPLTLIPLGYFGGLESIGGGN